MRKCQSVCDYSYIRMAFAPPEEKGVEGGGRQKQNYTSHVTGTYRKCMLHPGGVSNVGGGWGVRPYSSR